MLLPPPPLICSAQRFFRKLGSFFRLFRFLLANIIPLFTRPAAWGGGGEAEKHRPYPTGYPCSSVALPPYPLFIARTDGAAYCEERSTVQKPRDLVHSAPPSLRRLRSKRTLHWPVHTVLYVEADGHPSEVEYVVLPCSVKWEYLVNDIKLVARVPMRTWDDINGVGRVSQVLDCNQGTYCTVTCGCYLFFDGDDFPSLAALIARKRIIHYFPGFPRIHPLARSGRE